MGTVAATMIAMMMTVTPSNGGVLAVPQITINDSVGDQSDPHVDGNLAAYSNTLTSPNFVQEIRYYDFVQPKDLAIPNTLGDGTVVNDLLSDIDQGRIVFTRIFPSPSQRTAIMLFDATTQVITELAPAPSTQRYGVAIGGQTVAFIDYGLAATSELMILDLTSPSTPPLRITTDLAEDANPAVSPDGSVVTWESCPVSTADCNIYSATRTGTGWVTTQLSSSLINEANPDTNGSQVVFERNLSAADSDIVVVPSAGGAETVLQIPGLQFNPSIRGQYVAFQSRATAASTSDIYLVDLASNRIFQITDTPAVSETLNDVTVLPAGELRIVWRAGDLVDLGMGNIFGATFVVPVVNPPVGGGAGGGAGGGGGSTCANRSVLLEATRFYHPTRSVDGHVNFSPSMSFAIPGALPVTAGNAGNKKATLTIDLGNKEIECEYRSGSSQSHPSTPAQLALASSYRLTTCEEVRHGCGGHGDDDDDDDDDGDDGDDDGDDDHHGGHGRHRHSGPRYGAGTIVNATSASLHIQNGDMTQPLTRVSIALAEVCGTSSVSSPLNAGNTIDGAQTGCSSSGGTLVPFLAVFGFLALMLRRPAAIRLVTRRERRTLPR